ncbi:MAG TPA: DUF2953 domain-containing protein [Candidatus Gallacutalibacter pullicola]|uniref:DUF2953 domain-containing protein n=1 Tax=Candidatus Gallacutalibacter pullicola TaxID=2840830 RepID=A0A9D1J2R1_9FIRM|nr:DUF2953 domain-containing protein [Candidatus Gallacutalibacter pullicola]
MLVFGGIVLLLILLLCCPITLRLSFLNGFSVRLKYLFFSFQLLPPKEKSTGKKKRASQKKKKSEEESESTLEKLRKLTGEDNAAGLFDFLRELAVLAAGSLKKLFRHLVIADFSLDVSAGGEDAAETALTYGKLCAVIYPAVSVLVSQAKTKHYGVSVFPDFSEGAQTKAHMEARLRIKPVFLLSAGIGFLAKLVLAFFKKKISGQETQQ